MVRVRMIKIRQYERGLLFKDREFARILRPGRYYVPDPLWRVRCDVVSVRQPWLRHEDLEVIVRSGALGDEANVLDLRQHERALVWVNGRFACICPPGLSVLWTVFHEVRTEVIDARGVRFEHPELDLVLEAAGSERFLQPEVVDNGHTGLVFINGQLREVLAPGSYAFWRGMARLKVLHLDLREQVVDVTGQELITKDKVTLRLNAVVTYRITDPRQAVSEVEDPGQALYRQAQLALRKVIGTRELDTLLADREAVAADLTGVLRQRAEAFGVKVDQLGIRDVILPGDMKDLFNRVTEAQKAAEAALITRREETAAMRSQANTARILDSNPTLMRLRELEVLEKVAEKSQLNIVLGESGLTDRVVKLL
jgi:hypothetical protein